MSFMYDGTRKFVLDDFYLTNVQGTPQDDAVLTLLSALTISRSLKDVVKFFCFTNHALTNSHSWLGSVNWI
jgi:hypothetical protein